mgnify:CR=1 FL=1
MIQINNVSKWYGEFQVLTDCTTEVKKGEVVVVCGPSGSGKSTLIKTVNALEPFQKGEILVEGVSVGDPKTNLPKLRSRVGMVFQRPTPFAGTVARVDVAPGEDPDGYNAVFGDLVALEAYRRSLLEQAAHAAAG